MPYKPLADSTLSRMTKAEIIEILRCAEHNAQVFEETLNQHIENVKDWQPVTHCKDCKHRTEAGNCGHPRHHGILPSAYPYDFCSYGEPKEGNKCD